VKTLGLIGGMSWESTLPYYRIINESVRETLGGLHSAELILYSVDFDRIERLQATDRWDVAGEELARIASRLEIAGALALVLCTNTMHKVAPAIESAVSIPLLHIADPTGEELVRSGVSTVGLLGTSFTMEDDFYRERLESRFGLQVVVPDAADRCDVSRVIYQELCRGELLEDSRRRYVAVIERLAAEGAQAVILGCTEIGLLVGASDVGVPLLDTTYLHARAAARWALAQG